MTTQTSDLEYETRRALQHWIAVMLEEVHGLPHWHSVKNWTRDDLHEAVVRCRRALGAVRLYASEFTEHTALHQLDSRSTQAITYATNMCDQIEPEVTFVQDELMVYTK